MNIELINLILSTILVFLSATLLCLAINEAKFANTRISVTTIADENRFLCTGYRVTRRDMELRIYNHINGRYEYYPIWHFKNPGMIATIINPRYAKKNGMWLYVR